MIIAKERSPALIGFVVQTVAKQCSCQPLGSLFSIHIEIQQLSHRESPMIEESKIRERAYALWEKDACPVGADLFYW
ncbi:MAG: DUF2934 domain-containing protein, partial [Pseudomonas fluorescens]